MAVQVVAQCIRPCTVDRYSMGEVLVIKHRQHESEEKKSQVSGCQGIGTTYKKQCLMSPMPHTHSLTHNLSHP